MPPRFRAGNALLLAGARGLSLLGFLAATALLSRALGPEDYGTFRQAWIVYTAAAPVLGVALGQSLFFFLPRTPSGASWPLARRTTWVALAASAGAAALLAALAGPVSAGFSNPSGAPHFRAFALFLAAAIPMQLSDGLLLPPGRTGAAAAFNVLNRLVVLLALALPVWALGLGLLQGLLVLGLGQAAALAALHAVARRAHAEGRVAPAVALGEQLRYAAPVAAAGVFGAVFLQLDKLVVARFLGPAEFATYSNGAFENPVVALLASASSASVAAELVRLRHGADHGGFVELWRQMVERLSLAALPMAAFLFAFAPEVVVLLFSERYADSAAVFRVYVLLTPIRIVGFSTLFMALDRNRTYLIGHVAACAALLATALPLAGAVGPLGPAAAMVATSFGLAGAFVWIAARDLGVRVRAMLPVRHLLLVSVVAVAAAAAARWAAGGPLGLGGVAALAAGGGIFAALTAGLLLAAGVLRPPAGPGA